jgi:hypothetical protein
LEDVNNILNSGDVPNLYAVDEQERILTAMKPVVQDLGQQPTKANLMTAYIKRVRSNIHTVLCMRSDSWHCIHTCTVHSESIQTRRLFPHFVTLSPYSKMN